jgi:2-hydroxychromene-2-carboxylate isomerase
MGVDAAFYFDLASPEAYLAAERALAVLPGPCLWQPVLLTADEGGDRAAFRAQIEHRAAALALPAVLWPEPFPFDSELAMLAATFAARIGKCVPFALAAFRQAFAGGHALSDPDHVVIAGAACEMHPSAILRAVRTRGVRDELARASAEARGLGVSGVPAVRVGERVLIGEDRLEDAGSLLAELGGGLSS